MLEMRCKSARFNVARCQVCDAAVRICRMCRFYDPSLARGCRQPIADEVKDKDRANFCDHLELIPGAYVPADHAKAHAAMSDLNTLFGLNPHDDEVTGRGYV